MNKTRAFVFWIILLIVSVSSTQRVNAQDGILDEVSYLYLNKLIAAAKANYPRIKNLNSQVASAKTDLSTVKASWLEPFSFQYVTRSNRASSNLVNVTTADVLNGYQFGIAVNPGSLLAKPSQIKKAKEQINVAKYELEEYMLTLEVEVKTRYFNYLQAQKSISTLNNAVLDAESNVKLARLAYEKAEGTLEELNLAGISYNTAFKNKLIGETEYLTAKASLEELTVMKLEEIK